MCESILANVLLIVFSGGLGALGFESEDTRDLPALSYEEGRVRPGRLGVWEHSSLHTALAAHRTTVLPSPVADKSSKWIGALRSSLMRDNYDYPPPEPETLAPLELETSGETSDDTQESSGDTSDSTDEHGQPSAQDYDKPTPRSLNNSPAVMDRSSSKARPDVDPIHQNISRKNMHRGSMSGLEIPPGPVPGYSDFGVSSRHPYRPGVPGARGHGDRVVTMPPRTAENAALIDEINEEFETKRRSYLESLYELEDQLRPVYRSGGSAHGGDARAQQQIVDRRGGGDHGLWNDLDRTGIKSGSQSYIGYDGIRRYKVFKNAMEKFQPLVEDYLDNHPEAAAELIPWHKQPWKRNQVRMTGLHQAHRTHNVKPTYRNDESVEYVEDRTTPRYKLRNRSKERSRWKGKTKGDQWYTRHHGRHKKQRSMYLESAELPSVDSDGFVQRYNSRRNADLLEDASDLLSGSPSPASSTSSGHANVAVPHEVST